MIVSGLGQIAPKPAHDHESPCLNHSGVAPQRSLDTLASHSSRTAPSLASPRRGVPMIMGSFDRIGEGLKSQNLRRARRLTIEATMKL